MFSDKNRTLKVIIPLVFIVILIIYGHLTIPLYYPGYEEAIKNPRQFIGKEILFGGRILKIENDFFYTEINKQPIKVLGKVERYKLNYLITGNAVYQIDGSLKPTAFHTSNLRKYKIALSIIPIILVLFLFLKQYHFDIRTFMFRRHA